MSNGIESAGSVAMRQLSCAYCRRRRFATSQFLVEAGEDCLNINKCI
jgi:hypothetical protein